MKCYLKTADQVLRRISPYVPAFLACVVLPGVVLCNLVFCYHAVVMAFSRRAGQDDQARSVREVLLWDIRNSTSILPADDHQLLLRTHGHLIKYEFDPKHRTLVRKQGNDILVVLKDVDSASFFLCQRPNFQAAQNSAGIVQINWKTRTPRGSTLTQTAVACL